MAKLKQRTGCRQCGGQLPPPGETGRPRRYCGDVCRRLAEYEIRRVQSHLSRSEREMQKARMNAARGVYQGAETWELWKAEVDRLTGEFRDLLTSLATDET